MSEPTADEAIEAIQKVCHDARYWRESGEAEAAIREAFAVQERAREELAGLEATDRTLLTTDDLKRILGEGS